MAQVWLPVAVDVSCVAGQGVLLDVLFGGDPLAQCPVVTPTASGCTLAFSLGELAPGVRVNAVAPAVVKTRFAAALFEEREAEVARRYPLGRLGLPADVAAAVAYLVSDEASWVTGQTMTLDGGLTQLSGDALADRLDAAPGADQ